MSDDPVCCGETMIIDSYDSDDDVYVYVCAVNRKHITAIEDEDETWK